MTATSIASEICCVVMTKPGSAPAGTCLAVASEVAWRTDHQVEASGTSGSLVTVSVGAASRFD